MDFSVLPKYPLPGDPGSAAGLPKRGQALFGRLTRIFLEVVFLAVFVVMLYELRPMTAPTEDPAPLPTLDFKLIEERYGKVHLFTSREEVWRLLGQPTAWFVWEPDFEELMKTIEFWNRDFGLPSEQVWVRWTDPTDDGKSVTILLAGGKVYHKFKKGF